MVEIALVGDRNPMEQMPAHGWIGSEVEQIDWTLAWDARPRVSVRADKTKTLASALDEAVAHFGVEENKDWSRGFGTGRFVAFRCDTSPLPLRTRLADTLTLTDEFGHAIWERGDFGRITMGDITRASAAAAIEGDPSQLYLNVRTVPAGGGVLMEWPILVQGWDAAWWVVNHAAAAWGAFELTERLRARLRKRDTPRRKAAEWVKRNGYPHALRQMMTGRSWRARDLAGLLGCTVGEAEGVIQLYGYAPSEDGEVWVYVAGRTGHASADNLAARILREYVDEVTWHYSDSEVSGETLTQLFSDVARRSIGKTETKDGPERG